MSLLGWLVGRSIFLTTIPPTNTKPIQVAFKVVAERQGTGKGKGKGRRQEDADDEEVRRAGRLCDCVGLINDRSYD